MEIKQLLNKVEQGDRVRFDEVMSLIDQHYSYRPVRFTNGGEGDKVVNEAGSNQGSCKIFSFAKLHRLSEEATLGLFGDYYWRDVLDNPGGEDHANIRQFIRYGWQGIDMPVTALSRL